MSGSLVVVGAAEKTVGSNFLQGAAYVFSCPTATTCTSGLALVTPNGAAEDLFGSSVAVFGSLVAVGADGKTVGSNSQQGAVYVFNCSSSICTQGVQLQASNGAAGDHFGASVSISGSLLVIGAFGASGSTGAAWIFNCPSSSSCTQGSELAGPSGSLVFGASVSISGTLVVVWAPQTYVGGNQDQGTAYIFSCPTASSCSQGYALAASNGVDDTFGTSISLSGSLVIVGATSGATASSGGPKGSAFLC